MYNHMHTGTYMKQGVFIMKIRKIVSCVCLTAMAISVIGCSVPESAVTSSSDTAQTEASTEKAKKADIDISGGVPDETVLNCCKDASYKDLVIKGHSFSEIEEGDYAGQDIVSLEIDAGNSSGKLPQKICKDVTFKYNVSTKEWENTEENCTSWNVDIEQFPASKWKAKDAKTEDLAAIFADKIPSGQEGDLFVSFKSNLSWFSFNLTEQVNNAKEHEFVTNGNGTFTWVSGEDVVTQSFKFLKGSITDSGDITLKATVSGAEKDLKLSSDYEIISDRAFDMGVHNPVADDKIYIEEVPLSINVSSTDLEGNMWKTVTGNKYENKSPELTWDEVEGASCYAIFMIDKVAGNFLHWYSLVEKTHLEQGQFSDKETGYVGPYPEETHEYTVYVVALKQSPKIKSFAIDVPHNSEEFADFLTKLNTAKDGSIGNVISYGSVKGDFDPTR